RAEVEASLGTADSDLAPVDDDLGALAHTGFDEGGDAVAVRLRNKRPHVDLVVHSGCLDCAVADPQGASALRDAGDQLVGDRTDGDENAYRHAALTGTTVARAHGSVGSEI